MVKGIKHKVTLNNGTEMPVFGLGVWKSEAGTETENAVTWALETGYIHIDTASLYKNEDSVGKAVKESGIPREQLFITTKVWNTDQGYKSTLKAFDDSLEKLGMDYVDLYLIHWPNGDLSVKTWKALEEIHSQGRSKAIGVSNFMVSHLDEFLPHCNVKPAVNQVEFHPYLQLRELQSFCQTNGIQLEAWAPIMKGHVSEVKELIEIGEKYGKTPPQVTIRWELQLGVITIPKSVRQHRIVENADVFDFELSATDMEVIASLEKNYRYGMDPYNFDF
ncbi:MAG: aldo/keto reductase [Bacteroidetes bacterium]|nr:aldo/keto reductase [Bacteroidota bacterium]MDA1120383.1 aldo/keto reductase [Bacteroidota bacterium]